jgi:hypothetical protein
MAQSQSGLSVSATYSGGDFSQVFSPRVRLHFMRVVGKDGRRTLRSLTMGANGVTLRKFPRDKKGRRTLRSRVIGSAKVKFTSYPMNLHEFPVNRGGSVVPGKFIVTKKFKSIMDSRIDRIVDIADRKVLQPAAKKV